MCHRVGEISQVPRTLAEKEAGRAHQLGVNLCVQPGVADEIDDPSLGVLGGHVQFVRQHAVKETERRDTLTCTYGCQKGRNTEYEKK